MMGYVYAIDAGDSVKIGWSRTPKRRLGQIKTSSPKRDLRLAGFFPGTREQERQLHTLLERWRICREWYRREGGVLVLLEKLPPVPDVGDRRRVFSGNDNPLAEYRRQTGETLEQVSSRIGVARNTLWRWEQGRAPDKKVWPAIIKATPITRQQLLRFAMATKYAEAAE